MNNIRKNTPSEERAEGYFNSWPGREGGDHFLYVTQWSQLGTQVSGDNRLGCPSWDGICATGT